MLNHHIAATDDDDDNDINLDGGGKESTWQGTLSVEPRFAPRDCFLVMRQRGASGNYHGDDDDDDEDEDDDDDDDDDGDGDGFFLAIISVSKY